MFFGLIGVFALLAKTRASPLVPEQSARCASNAIRRGSLNDSRLTQVSDPTGTYQFTFDNMGRLSGTSTQYAFLTSRTFTTSYGYDAASNRIGFTDPENGSSSYDAIYELLNATQGGSTTKARFKTPSSKPD